MVAVILAFRTRKVNIKALNDSKYLTIIIYISSVIIALMLISAVLLERYLNIDAAVFGGLILLFTTVVLGLTFIPKVPPIIREDSFLLEAYWCVQIRAYKIFLDNVCALKVMWKFLANALNFVETLQIIPLCVSGVYYGITRFPI